LQGCGSGAEAVAKKSISVIRIAVKSFLVRCRNSASPLTDLGDFADQLEAADWDSDSVRAFEQGVLVSLEAGDSEPGGKPKGG
jgi:hypothetical protein